MDTLTLATDLTEAGLDRTQADRIAAAIGRSLDGHVATVTDLERMAAALSADIGGVRADVTTLKADIERVETTLKADIERVETTLKANFGRVEAEVKADIATAKWQVLLAIFAAVGLFAALDRLI